jgi:hypothetical protein
MKYTIEPAKRKPFDFWVVFLFSSYFCEMKREKNGGYNTQRRLRGGVSGGGGVSCGRGSVCWF